MSVWTMCLGPMCVRIICVGSCVLVATTCSGTLFFGTMCAGTMCVGTMLVGTMYVRTMCGGTMCALVPCVLYIFWDHFCWGHEFRDHVASMTADYHSACRRRRGWDKLWEPTRLLSVLRICPTICSISNSLPYFYPVSFSLIGFYFLFSLLDQEKRWILIS